MKVASLKTIGLVACAAAAGLAVCRGEDMKTISGQVYRNIVVQQFDRQGLTVLHDGGTAQVPFSDILPELRGHYKGRAMIPVPLETMAGQREAPAGPNDLVTLSGQVFRNAVVKQVDDETIRITHDTGMATVYFSAIPKEVREKWRTGTPVVPDPTPGANDLVTTYGQVFRNVEIVKTEPDGLTYRHDGGVTKLWFPALPEEVRKKHGYDPVAAWKYQREASAAQRPAQEEVGEHTGGYATPGVEAPVLLHTIELEKLPDNKYWIRFSVRNLSDMPQTVQVLPCAEGMAAITDGKKVEVKARAEAQLQQIVVPELQPLYLKVTCSGYQTNTVLNWP